SDNVIYNSGFAVLRSARVPAILTEASFHSNVDEEARLRDPEYNRREAQALFAGLAHYALGGVPRMRLVSPANGRVLATSGAQVVIELDDGLRSRKSWGWQRRMILRDSIIVHVGNERWPFDYDEKTDRVTLLLPSECKPGALELNVQFENMFKHSNTQPRLVLQVGQWAAGDRATTNR
ncbi:MAG: N-acetylmuramoyl-L-alanine amidase, partial [Phycisphaerae bacterium]|nr:N-acetylmuramoyl-L-alanine amidase [Phycisphaerae bacterium]